MHQEVVGRARLPPRMPTRVTVMADSDGSLGRDDRHHRRSRSRSPVSLQSGRGRPSRSARSGGWRRRRWSDRRCRPGNLGQPRRPPPPPKRPAPPPRPALTRRRRRPRRATPRPRPRPPAHRRQGGQRRRASRAQEGLRRALHGPWAPRRRPPRQQRRPRRMCESLRPRPRAPRRRPPRQRRRVRRASGGRSGGSTPHGPWTPRRRPPQQRQWAGRARSTAPTPTPPTPTPAPPSRTPPSPSPRGGSGMTAPRSASAHRRASRCRNCKGSGTPGECPGRAQRRGGGERRTA